MGDVYMDAGYVIADWLSDKLTMILCMGILFAGLYQMNVVRLELIP